MGWWSLKKELFTYFFITSTVILIFLGIILYSVMDRTIYERVQRTRNCFWKTSCSWWTPIFHCWKT